MDLASLLGLLLCFGMCAFGMIQSAGLAHINRYLDLPSMIITFGGSFFAILMGSTLKDYIGGLKSFTLIFKAPDLDAKSMIQKIIDLSNVARKEGLLSLEEAAGNLDDDFMKKGILLIVDGTDPDLVRGIMETELISIEDRHKKNISRLGISEYLSPAHIGVCVHESSGHCENVYKHHRIFADSDFLFHNITDSNCSTLPHIFLLLKTTKIIIGVTDEM